MKDLLDIIFPTLSDELIIVISLIIGLLVTASLILFLVKKIFPKTNISELAARTRSWWIMAGMFIGAVFISYNISYFFLAFLSFIAFRELYSVLGFREADRGALFWGILAIPIQYYLAYLAWYGAFIIFIPVVMFLVLPLRLVLKGDTHGITKSMALLQWILMLSVFGISHLAYLLSLPELPGFSSGGRGLLLFLVFLTEINDIMQFIRPGYGASFGADGRKKAWWDALEDPGFNQMKYLKNLMLTFPFFERVPDQSVIAGTNGERYDRAIATRGNDYLLVYNYSGRPMQIDLSKISGAKKNAWWYSAKDGKLEYIGEFDSKVTPFQHDSGYLSGNDQVLIVVDSAKDYVQKAWTALPDAIQKWNK